MGDFGYRILWICILCTLVAYATYLLLGSHIEAKESMLPVVVRDNISLGEHHLSGVVMVPDSCDELSFEVMKIDYAHYKIAFTTWPEPSVECVHEPTARVFTTTVFAPSVGVQFIASLDAGSLPIAVYQNFVK